MAKDRGRHIQWQGDDIASYSHFLGDARKKMLDDIYNDLHEIGRGAVSDIKNTIQTSGTMTRPEGRVETGAMINSVDYVVNRMGDNLELLFGWPNGGPAYTKMQDRGTRDLHNKENVDPFNKPGVGIPGMMALLDSFVRARTQMSDRGLSSDR